MVRFAVIGETHRQVWLVWRLKQNQTKKHSTQHGPWHSDVLCSWRSEARASQVDKIDGARCLDVAGWLPVSKLVG